MESQSSRFNSSLWFKGYTDHMVRQQEGLKFTGTIVSMELNMG